MSKRNTQEAKRAGRERLQAERQKQAKREKLRRQLVVGATAIGVLAVAGAAGVAIANMGGGGDSTDWSAIAEELEEAGDAAEYEIPANTGTEDGLTIRLGDEEAETTLGFYEEPRCPACADFERKLGETVHEGIDAGDFTAEFTFGAFFDANVGGTGSKNAISALGAALNVSPEAFLGYLEALYSEEFHTSANKMDDFASDERLITIGKSVEALNEDFATFEKAVNDSTFAGWAVTLADNFARTPGAEGTPTVTVNGEIVTKPESPEQLRALLDAAAAQD